MSLFHFERSERSDFFKFVCFSDKGSRLFELCCNIKDTTESQWTNLLSSLRKGESYTLIVKKLTGRLHLCSHEGKFCVYLNCGPGCHNDMAVYVNAYMAASSIAALIASYYNKRFVCL
jgi:hypothetical protein